jgi:hypothetical protein
MDYDRSASRVRHVSRPLRRRLIGNCDREFDTGMASLHQAQRARSPVQGPLSSPPAIIPRPVYALEGMLHLLRHYNSDRESRPGALAGARLGHFFRGSGHSIRRGSARSTVLGSGRGRTEGVTAMRQRHLGQVGHCGEDVDRPDGLPRRGGIRLRSLPGVPLIGHFVIMLQVEISCIFAGGQAMGFLASRVGGSVPFSPSHHSRR